MTNDKLTIPPAVEAREADLHALQTWVKGFAEGELIPTAHFETTSDTLDSFRDARGSRPPIRFKGNQTGEITGYSWDDVTVIECSDYRLAFYHQKQRS